MEPKRSTAPLGGYTGGEGIGMTEDPAPPPPRVADADVFGESLEPLRRFSGKISRFIGLTRRGWVPLKLDRGRGGAFPACGGAGRTGHSADCSAASTSANGYE